MSKILMVTVNVLSTHSKHQELVKVKSYISQAQSIQFNISYSILK